MRVDREERLASCVDFSPKPLVITGGFSCAVLFRYRSLRASRLRPKLSQASDKPRLFGHQPVCLNIYYNSFARSIQAPLSFTSSHAANSAEKRKARRLFSALFRLNTINGCDGAAYCRHTGKPDSENQTETERDKSAERRTSPRSLSSINQSETEFCPSFSRNFDKFFIFCRILHAPYRALKSPTQTRRAQTYLLTSSTENQIQSRRRFNLLETAEFYKIVVAVGFEFYIMLVISVAVTVVNAVEDTMVLPYCLILATVKRL